MGIIDAIIFDFDGVLYDSEPNHLKACNSVFERLGFTISYDTYIKQYMGLSVPENLFK